MLENNASCICKTFILKFANKHLIIFNLWTLSYLFLSLKPVIRLHAQTWMCSISNNQSNYCRYIQAVITMDWCIGPLPDDLKQWPIAIFSVQIFIWWLSMGLIKQHHRIWRNTMKIPHCSLRPSLSLSDIHVIEL